MCVLPHSPSQKSLLQPDVTRGTQATLACRSLSARGHAVAGSDLWFSAVLWALPIPIRHTKPATLPNTCAGASHPRESTRAQPHHARLTAASRRYPVGACLIPWPRLDRPHKPLSCSCRRRRRTAPCTTAHTNHTRARARAHSMPSPPRPAAGVRSSKGPTQRALPWSQALQLQRRPSLPTPPRPRGA